jgi:hypothetical protein
MRIHFSELGRQFQLINLLGQTGHHRNFLRLQVGTFELAEAPNFANQVLAQASGLNSLA